MKIQTENVFEASVGLPDGELMEFDPEGAAELMAILSNQYSDGPLAVLREYITNGVDSHVVAGQTRPVEVALPTYMSPQLTITDYGVGLSREEIVTVYTRYGKSTKRGTNDQIGAFGIGAKAAFTLGSQFTVIGRKNGWRTVVLLALDEENRPKRHILSHEKTDEPNGVTVTIPVSDMSPFKNAARNLLAHFDPATVSCPGVEVGSALTGRVEVADGVWVREWPDNSYRQHFNIVMGQVCYPVSSTIVAHAFAKMGLKAPLMTFGASVEVPIGSVNLTPSRESLRDTGFTIATVAEALSRWLTGFATWGSNQMSSAKTMTEAIFASARVQQMFPNLGKVHKSLSDAGLSDLFPLVFEWDGNDVYRIERQVHRVSRVNATSTASTVKLSGDPSQYVVISDAHGWNVDSIKRRFPAYQRNNPEVTTLLLGREADDTGIDGLAWGEGSILASITMEEFREQSKRQAGARGGGGPRGSFTYEVYPPDEAKMTNMTLAELRELGDEVVVIPSGLHATARILAARKGDLYAVTLSGQQTEQAAHKRLPQARTADTLRSLMEEIVAETPTRIVELASMQARLRRDYRRNYEGLFSLLSACLDEVDDPSIATLVKGFLAFRGMSDADQRAVRHYRDLADVIGSTPPSIFDEVESRYVLLPIVASPLLNRDEGQTYLPAVIDYLNDTFRRTSQEADQTPVAQAA